MGICTIDHSWRSPKTAETSRSGMKKAVQSPQTGSEFTEHHPHGSTQCVYYLYPPPELHWVWTCPTGGTKAIASWKRMCHILSVLFSIQWGDKCKPVYYYCAAAVFLTTAYWELSDKDRKPWIVHSCYLYARPFSVILSEKWIKPSAPPVQPGTHFPASVSPNVIGWEARCSILPSGS